jgi:hypothetical protein
LRHEARSVCKYERAGDDHAIAVVIVN